MSEQMSEQMSELILEVPAEVCQASYGAHFIRSLTVISKTSSKIGTRSNIRIADDPYIERQLGHYSSSLLLEITKQATKGSVLLNYEVRGANHFIANEFRMEFDQYLLLDEAYEVAIESEIDVFQHRGRVFGGQTTARFFQCGLFSAFVYVDWLCVTPALEKRLERKSESRFSTEAAG